MLSTFLKQRKNPFLISTKTAWAYFSTSQSSSYFIHQFSTPCLAEFAYYIESNGEAAIIDPLRETEPYIEMAKKRGAKIKYIFETHFHADFVSGHVDLARLTGAKIVYGPTASANYNIYSAKDGEELKLGKVNIKVLHTPGHTPESSCYLLQDENSQPRSVFTGDTLFLGEVGRPDLAVKSSLTKEDLAGMLYESLRKKIMPLPDETVVYPAHGAGSPCGKNISSGTSCTIGRQRQNNYALKPMTKEEFINIVASDLPVPPKYFFFDAAMNKNGYTSIEDVFAKNLKPLSLSDVNKATKEGAMVIDCREQKEIAKSGIIPGSVAISLNGPFAIWVGTLLDPTNKLIVLCEPGKEKEAVLRLARIGFENCVGFIEGGIDAWTKQGGAIESMPILDTKEYLNQGSKVKGQNIELIDIRNINEWRTGVMEDAKLLSLSQLPSRIGELEKNKKYYILCGSGVRAKIAYSLMKRNGFNDLVVLEGGATKMKQDGGKFVDWKE